MKQALIIEDDKVLGNAYRCRLLQEGFQVRLEGTGTLGLAALRQQRPDFVILDLVLPEVSGVDVLRFVRAEAALRDLPVIVLSNAYSSEKINEAWQLGATEVLSKSTCTPNKVMEIIRHLTTKPPAATPAAKPTPPPPAAPATAPEIIGSDEDFQAELRRVCLHAAPAEIETIRRALQTVVKNPADDAVRQELYRRVHSITGNSGLAGLSVINRFAGALESLLKELQDKPDRINPSVTRTLAQAVDVLAKLFAAAEQPDDPTLGTGTVLQVDDEEIARKAAVHALSKTGLKVVSVADPAAALEQARQQAFALIVSDIEMPVMNGLELCKKIRELPAHKKTPLVFVTTLSGFEHRAQAVLSGGNDLIGKPYLFSELSVKALSLVVNHQLTRHD